MRAALYLRTETPAGEISRSVLRLRRLALELGLHIRSDDVLIDAGYPGGASQRPGFIALCRLVQAGEIEAVVVGSVAALAESLAAFETLWRAAEGRHLEVYEFAGPDYPHPLRRRQLGDLAGDVAALERRLAWHHWLDADEPSHAHERHG